MALVKAKNIKSGITYVYDSTSYWDKEKKQPRNKRKLIGKVDEQTGEIVPTRKRAKTDQPNRRTTVTEPCNLCRAYENRVADMEASMLSQAVEIAGLMAQRKELASKLLELAKSCGC